MKRYRKMTTAQLDELLQTELRKDTPDEEVVLPILEILGDRERKPHRKKRWIISLTAAAAVFALLITIVPKTVGANSLWDAVLHMTDSVVQFFTPGDTPDPTEAEYVFETDNLGLQQLYDKLVELGITDPVVPMWLPNGFELVEIKETSMPNGEKVHAVFVREHATVIISYQISSGITTTQYESRQASVEVYESCGIGHAITQNNEKWMATWVRGGTECLITADLIKEELCEVIDSIYRRN